MEETLPSDQAPGIGARGGTHLRPAGPGPLPVTPSRTPSDCGSSWSPRRLSAPAGRNGRRRAAPSACWLGSPTSGAGLCPQNLPVFPAHWAALQRPETGPAPTRGARSVSRAVTWRVPGRIGGVGPGVCCPALATRNAHTRWHCDDLWRNAGSRLKILKVPTHWVLTDIIRGR